jgi:hydrogenase maturation factor
VTAGSDRPGADHGRGDAPCDEVCITCSDQATAVRVVELLGDGLALVDTGSSLEQVSVALVDAAVGDRVLVHAKEAIAVMEDR